MYINLQPWKSKNSHSALPTRVDHVQNMSDGEVYLKTERPTLIIIDNKLPDGFGVDFIPFLKNIYPEVRITMMSGFGAAVMDVTMENGADIFLEKPFSKEALFNAVHQLMNSEMIS